MDISDPFCLRTSSCLPAIDDLCKLMEDMPDSCLRSLLSTPTMSELTNLRGVCDAKALHILVGRCTAFTSCEHRSAMLHHLHKGEGADNIKPPDIVYTMLEKAARLSQARINCSTNLTTKLNSDTHSLPTSILELHTNQLYSDDTDTIVVTTGN